MAQKTKTNAMTQRRTGLLTLALAANQAEVRRREWDSLQQLGEFILEKSEVSKDEGFLPNNQQVQELLRYCKIDQNELKGKIGGNARNRKIQSVDFELRDIVAGIFKELTKPQREKVESYFQEMHNGKSVNDVLEIPEGLFPVSVQE